MSLYHDGRDCSVCGKHLESSDSYSIVFGAKEDFVTCTDCDLDFNNRAKTLSKRFQELSE
jgi:transcription elongation factor Elf1